MADPDVGLYSKHSDIGYLSRPGRARITVAQHSYCFLAKWEGIPRFNTAPNRQPLVPGTGGQDWTMKTQFFQKPGSVTAFAWWAWTINLV